MIRADLAVGGGGVTTLERCCLGLPALVAVLADNQQAPTVAATRRGAIVNLGRAESLKAADYARAVASVTREQLLAMQESSIRLVDGLGCERVAQALATS
jgi:UDP-2,4-diacetamido-2,4,6-trideoxy-beta-L-altropyranose hydrolase